MHKSHIAYRWLDFGRQINQMKMWKWKMLKSKEGTSKERRYLWAARI